MTADLRLNSCEDGLTDLEHKFYTFLCLSVHPVGVWHVPLSVEFIAATFTRGMQLTDESQVVTEKQTQTVPISAEAPDLDAILSELNPPPGPSWWRRVIWFPLGAVGFLIALPAFLGWGMMAFLT